MKTYNISHSVQSQCSFNGHTPAYCVYAVLCSDKENDLHYLWDEWSDGRLVGRWLVRSVLIETAK